MLLRFRLLTTCAVFSLFIIAGCAQPDGGAAEPAEAATPEPVANPIPIPDTPMSLNDYAELLRESGFDATVQRDSVGDSGHFVISTWLPVDGVSLEQGLAIGAALYGFPDVFKLNAAQLDSLDYLENPSKPDYMWEDALVAERDSTGAITAIVHYTRREGSGASEYIDVTASGVSFRTDWLAD